MWLVMKVHPSFNLSKVVLLGGHAYALYTMYIYTAASCALAWPAKPLLPALNQCCMRKCCEMIG